MRSGELDQAMADEGRLADQHVLEPRMPRVPPRERGARPAPDGEPDHAVRDTALLRVPLTRPARLEYGPGDVPLQEVDPAPPRVREVGELVDQETLAGAGEPREEDEPRVAGQDGEDREEGRLLARDESAWGCGPAHRSRATPFRSPRGRPAPRPSRRRCRSRSPPSASRRRCAGWPWPRSHCGCPAPRRDDAPRPGSSGWPRRIPGAGAPATGGAP